MENPIPENVIQDLQRERLYQLTQGATDKGYSMEGWSYEFDDSHHAHDWAAFIIKYLGRVTDAEIEVVRTNMVKVATLAVAAIESIDRAVTRVEDLKQEQLP